MKKKILCLAMAIAMTMSSAVFAADTLDLSSTRDSGDVTQADATDADAPGVASTGVGTGLTAYDAALIQYYANGGDALDNVEAEGNYNGKIGITESDANLVLSVVNDPKLKTDNYLTLTTAALNLDFSFPKESQLPSTTLKDSLDIFLTDDGNVGAIENNIDRLNTAINKISFNSAVMGSVALTTENGWAVFLTEIQPILDLNGTAGEVNEYGYLTGGTGDSYDAMAAVKAKIVGGANLKYNDLVDIVDTIEKGLPESAFTADEAATKAAILETAANVQSITTTKFDFGFVTEKDVTGANTSATAFDGSEGYAASVDDLAAAINSNELYKYETKTIEDLTNVFGYWIAGQKTGGREMNAKVTLHEVAQPETVTGGIN